VVPQESTFSLFVREWRYLHGRPRSSSALVAAVVPDHAGQASLPIVNCQKTVIITVQEGKAPRCLIRSRFSLTVAEGPCSSLALRCCMSRVLQA